MKIDAKVSSFAIAAFFGAYVSLTASALAQTGTVKVDFAADPSSQAASSVTVSAPSQAASAASITVDAPQSSAPKPLKTTSDKKSNTAALEEEEEAEDVGNMPKNVPESVKGVVSRLNKATKDVTIEDLNAAREAIVKLDVLIDIEKRLNDLTTLRQEREEKDEEISAEQGSEGIALGGRLPAGGAAMAPPPALSPAQALSNAPSPAAVMQMMDRGIEVKKVVGASGHYMATIMDVDGSEKRVRAGDTLANGSVVNAISRSGVTVTSTDKKKNTIQVKDIGTVFGG